MSYVLYDASQQHMPCNLAGTIVYVHNFRQTFVTSSDVPYTISLNKLASKRLQHSKVGPELKSTQKVLHLRVAVTLPIDRGPCFAHIPLSFTLHHVPRGPPPPQLRVSAQ
jgi:hypothetical protein